MICQYSFENSYPTLGSVYKFKRNALNIPNCTLVSIYPTKDGQNIIYQYSNEKEIGGMFIVYNIQTAEEMVQYSYHPVNPLKCYTNGFGSNYGYLLFESCIVNLDDCFPNPFGHY